MILIQKSSDMQNKELKNKVFHGPWFDARATSGGGIVNGVTYRHTTESQPDVTDHDGLTIFAQ